MAAPLRSHCPNCRKLRKQLRAARDVIDAQRTYRDAPSRRTDIIADVELRNYDRAREKLRKIGVVLIALALLGGARVMAADLMLATGTTKPHPLIWTAPLSATRFQLRARPAFSTAPYQNVGEIMTDLDARCVVMRVRQMKICRTMTDVDRKSWHETWWGDATAWRGRIVESNRTECVGSDCVVLAGSVK